MACACEEERVTLLCQGETACLIIVNEELIVYIKSLTQESEYVPL